MALQDTVEKEWAIAEPSDDKRRGAHLEAPHEYDVADENLGEFVPAGESGDDPITRNLKKVYAEIAAEPIPDELLDLLMQLDAKEGGEDA